MTLDIDKVYDELCYHDVRNQSYYNLHVSHLMEPAARCLCDNCVYGRHELAVEIIRLMDELICVRAELASIDFDDG